MVLDTLILATGSKGKIAELSSLLPTVRCIAQSQLQIGAAAETGLTFVENAIIKARHASRQGAYPALADDSGLVIDALQGQPGIYSARFAGDKASDRDNIAKVLQALVGVPPEQRQAHYYCAIVVLMSADDPAPLLATGRLDGTISLAPQGNNGFGYDPIFFLPEQQCTVAELSSAQKNAISHRAAALRVLKMLF